MLQFKAYDLSVSSVVWRYYLMMAIIVGLGFLNLWALAVILALIVAVSFIVGISVNIVKPKKTLLIEKSGKLSPVDKINLRNAA